MYKQLHNINSSHRGPFGVAITDLDLFRLAFTLKRRLSSTYWQRYVIRFLRFFLFWGYIWGRRQWWFWHFHHSAQWKVVQFFWAVPVLSTEKKNQHLLLPSFQNVENK